MWRKREVLTRVRAGQVVPGVRLFDDVLVDLGPLALRVTPDGKRETRGQNRRWVKRRPLCHFWMTVRQTPGLVQVP